MAYSSKISYSTYPPSYRTSVAPSTTYSSYTLNPPSEALTMHASPPPPATQPKGHASYSTDWYAVDSAPSPPPLAQPPPFPTLLPTRNKPIPAQKVSFFRFLWYIRPGAFALWNLPSDSRLGSKTRTCWRRISMLWIVLMRIGISAEMILLATWEQWLFILYLVFSIVGLYSVLACLTNIGDAVGTRRELGMNIGRKWLDVFLYVMVFLHTATAGLWIIMYFYNSAFTATLWLLWWISMFVVAWMAAQPADQTASQWPGA